MTLENEPKVLSMTAVTVQMSYLLDWSICDAPIAFVVGIGVAVAVAQIATKTKKSFVILSPESILSSRFSSLRSSDETRSRCDRFIVNFKSMLRSACLQQGDSQLSLGISCDVRYRVPRNTHCSKPPFFLTDKSNTMQKLI